MKSSKKTFQSLCAITLISTSLISFTALAAETLKSDNSQVNEHIEANQELNSQDQGSSTEDIAITQKIRQQIMKQNHFSTNAKNVKIITLNGLVVLKGPVKAISEKSKIESIAKIVAGKRSVTNEITVIK